MSMTDYAVLYDTDRPMAERRDALVTLNTDRDQPEALLPPVLGQDFRRVIAHLPYAAVPGVTVGDVRMGSYRDPLNAVDVLDTLRGLGVTLMVASKERERMESELRQIKADLAAMRRVFGLAPGGDLNAYGQAADR